MKKQPRTPRAKPALRSFGLHARFTPEGPEQDDADSFRAFYREATGRAQTLRARDLKKREARLNALKGASDKTQPIVRRLLQNKISPDEAARKLRRLVPDKALAAELLDHWQSAVAATPESVAKRGEEIEREEADLLRLTRLGKADKDLHRSLWRLSDAAMAGDEDAARMLAEAATSATAYLQFAERARPEVFCRLARTRLQWPVLGSDETGWEKAAARRVAALDLGADLQVFKVRFRSPRGTDANLPARLWAKAAVRVVEETRWGTFMVAQLNRDFGSSGALADFCMEAGWKVSPTAKWRDEAAALPPFSVASLAKWKPVVRRMIREEMPKFHLQKEWDNQRRTAARNGRDSTGEIQNAILDDIISALMKLAPVARC